MIFAQHTLSLLAVAAQSPFSNYWSKLTDPSRNPFRGLYQLNTFDLAIMIPYFVVLVILAAYGMHRYYLVYAYFKNRHNVPGPPPAVTEWPKVTIQLPIYNERYVIERLVDAVARFDYPRELLDIQVLDDSTDETRASRARLRRALPGARPADPLPASHRPHRLQGRRARRGTEIRDGRIRRHLRRRFPALAGFSAPHAAVFHRSQNRHGADALDLSEPPLLRAHRSRNASCSTAIS